MLKKIDNILRLLWFEFFPMLMSGLLIIAALDLFVWYDDEMGVLWLNIACLCAVIILSGWLLSFILELVISIVKAIKKKKNKEKDNGLQ